MLQKGFDQVAKLGCRWRYDRQLSAYLDNELNAQAEKVIAGHLRECGRCRVSFEELRYAKRALVEFEIPQTRRPLSGGQVFQLPVSKEVFFLKRLYAQRIAVPVPLAAGVVVALIGATLFALGRNQRPIQSIVSVPAPSSAVIKVVEVPVERVVTRIVYSRRSGYKRVRATQKENGFTLTSPELRDDLAQNARGTVEWSDSTLKNFRPAASANLRVVREDEK